jgi:hypothetical protein
MRGAVWIGICLIAVAGSARAQTDPVPAAESPTLTRAEVRELLDAAKATAKAARENVDYVRVVPDMLFQILTKLDKIEDKLDKVENAIKRDQATRAKAR